MDEDFDVAVIGAGFGGLGAALRLAELGAKVVLFEALKYPGGCASTFTRGGWRFESGATLFAGFNSDQLFGRWIDRYAMPVETRVIDPLVELISPHRRFPIPPTRERLVAQFLALPGAPRERLVSFFERQSRAADALWALFDDPGLLPPFGAAELVRHGRHALRYLPLVTMLGRSLRDVLDDHGLADWEPLRTYLDAVSQITVQASSAEAEAPFAIATMDYYFRGTRHVHGGIGRLADAMVATLKNLGVTVSFADRVSALEREGTAWKVTSRKHALRARNVVANLLPQDLARLVPEASDALAPLASRVEQGWGAVMLYLGIDPHAALRPEAHHLELIDDPAASFTEGNHLFVSLSAADETDRGPDEARTATVSTHIPLAALRALAPAAQAERVAAIQARMRATLLARAPELASAITHSLTASPRTFAKFTGRFAGYVGGIPRRVGLDNYRGMLPSPIIPGLWMVGDSVFPGQSTLATAIGGVKVAERLGAGRA